MPAKGLRPAGDQAGAVTYPEIVQGERRVKIGSENEGMVSANYAAMHFSLISHSSIIFV